MKNQNNKIQLNSIQFFGKISASATHEIKNTQAIINENAGLLDDLILMADRGQPLSMEKFQKISENIIKQVQRTDLILTNLNQFSHSADLNDQILNMEEVVQFVLDLSSRLIDMLGINVQIQPAPAPIIIQSNLFYFESLIWKSIENACKVSGDDKTVVISFGINKDEPEIRFSINSEQSEQRDHFDNLFSEPEDSDLFKLLDVTLKKDKKNKSFGLRWPKNFK